MRKPKYIEYFRYGHDAPPNWFFVFIFNNNVRASFNRSRIILKQDLIEKPINITINRTNGFGHENYSDFDEDINIGDFITEAVEIYSSNEFNKIFDLLDPPITARRTFST